MIIRRCIVSTNKSLQYRRLERYLSVHPYPQINVIRSTENRLNDSTFADEEKCMTEVFIGTDNLNPHCQLRYFPTKYFRVIKEVQLVRAGSDVSLGAPEN